MGLCGEETGEVKRITSISRKNKILTVSTTSSSLLLPNLCSSQIIFRLCVFATDKLKNILVFEYILCSWGKFSHHWCEFFILSVCFIKLLHSLEERMKNFGLSDAKQTEAQGKFDGIKDSHPLRVIGEDGYHCYTILIPLVHNSRNNRSPS